MSRRRLRSATWLAALAIALHALWPLLVHARPGSAATLVPVCTVEGVTHYIELLAGKTPLEERSSSHQEHCAFCFFGAERAALASHFQVPIAGLTEVSSAWPESAPFTAKTSFFSPGRPRAPPLAP